MLRSCPADRGLLIRFPFEAMICFVRLFSANGTFVPVLFAIDRPFRFDFMRSKLAVLCMADFAFGFLFAGCRAACVFRLIKLFPANGTFVPMRRAVGFVFFGRGMFCNAYKSFANATFYSVLAGSLVSVKIPPLMWAGLPPLT